MAKNSLRFCDMDAIIYPLFFGNAPRTESSVVPMGGRAVSKKQYLLLCAFTIKDYFCSMKSLSDTRVLSRSTPGCQDARDPGVELLDTRV